MHLDANGLPIHGLVAASPYWRETGRTPGNGSAAIGGPARLRGPRGADVRLPLPARAAREAELSAGRSGSRTIVLPTGDVAVPSRSAGTPTCACRASRAPSGASSCRCAGARCSTSAACRPGRASPSRSSPARSVSAPTTTTSSSSSSPHGLRPRGRRAPDRGRVRRGLLVRAGLRPAGDRRRALRLLRADDGAGQRADQRRRAAQRAARRQLPGGVHAVRVG